MTALISTGALLLAMAALVSAAAALLATQHVTLALPVLLEMLLAASLLRLTAHPSIPQLVGTGMLVAVKRLTSAGLRRASAVRRPAATS